MWPNGDLDFSHIPHGGAREQEVVSYRRLNPTRLAWLGRISEKLQFLEVQFPARCVCAVNFTTMAALYQRAPYQTADRQKIIENESDQEEDALVNDYQEQVHFDEGLDEVDGSGSYGGSGAQFQDMQAQLNAAATPLEYQATLETKFASYDNYCNLFHYILNSDGPVDLEPPSVSSFPRLRYDKGLIDTSDSLSGPGT